MLPFPQIRDNLIKWEAYFDHWEFMNDIFGDIISNNLPVTGHTSGPIPKPDSLTLEEEDPDSVTAGQRGFIIWGEPHKKESWEATPSFFRKWAWVMEGCDELVEQKICKSVQSMDEETLEAVSKQAREAAGYAHDQRIAFDNVKSECHHDTLDRAIRNILRTDLTIFTYAQIIDGLSTADVAWDRRLPGIFGNHIIDDHEELCPEATDRALEFYETWDPSILRFDPQVIHDYEQAEPGSKLFNLRLIELVAVSLHQIGVALFKLDLRLHNGDIESVINWKMPLSPAVVDVPPRATLFNHPAYFDDDIYPEGLSDVVGYWAEDRILGGVTVFDRRPQGDPSNPPNVYFHSCRDHVTDRVYQLRDEQQHALLGFLLSGDSSECPLPVLADSQNRVRFDWTIAHTHHQIFRDIWERKPLTHDDLSFMRRRPREELDYPEIGEMIRRVNAQLGIPLPRPRSRSPSPPLNTG
ncbi:hypothetical protein G7Z17_g5996 [Cylindrodendrum hubeiense]|uniref:Uncharacterized protein n=1 Tax=Cylindrodendrum hubeiense TaxID=595255 RepID=A0A9P5HD52_9HYPO|nr:hypothetical protein G7Z17_g5996 [Cylindrodendrum hubeiense]